MRKTTLMRPACILLLCILWTYRGRADDGWDGHIFSLLWENDATAGSDRHYTQGAGLSYLSTDNTLPEWVKAISHATPAFGYDIAAEKWGLAIMQEIYTPENLQTSALLVNDRPYAGWLYTTATIQRRGKTRHGGFPVMEHLRLDLGIIGPASLAEETQKSWHGIEPKGWEHQLRNEPGLNVRYDRAYLFSAWTEGSNWRGDIIPYFDMSAGNVLTYFQLGSTFRLGYHVPNEFATTHEGGRAFGAYFFTRVQGRVVLRNIFLDGNTFRDSHSIDKQYLVGDVRFGITFAFKHLEITAAHTLVSEEFNGEHGTDSYGTAMLTLKF
jgi:lipid A 3-O-deacylase